MVFSTLGRSVGKENTGVDWMVRGYSTQFLGSGLMLTDLWSGLEL